MKKTTLLSNAEIAAFCRQTSMIIHAGITPAEGMIILKNDTIDSEGKAILEQIANLLERSPDIVEKFKTVFQKKSAAEKAAEADE